MPERSAILVVEDTQDDVFLVTKMLRRSRVLNPVHAVSSVAGAVCYIKGEGTYVNRHTYPEPILIFVDLHLGSESGFDLLNWLKRTDKPRAFGVVVLSGTDIYAVDRAYHHGADSFLVKPLNWEDFQHLITRLRGITLLFHRRGPPRAVFVLIASKAYLDRRSQRAL